MKSKIIFVLILLCILIFFSGCTEKNITDLKESTMKKGNEVSQNLIALKNLSSDDAQKNQTKVNTAVEISNQIKKMDLKQIDLKKIQTPEDYAKMVDNLNLAIKIINDKVDSDFKSLQKGTESYDKFMMEIDRYSPLIDNYNEFIQSSYNLIPSDECSVNNLYINGIKFAGEATLILGGAFYKTAFLTTGELARDFGLIKFTSICGPCVSAAMSSSHWIIRNSITEQTTKTIENVFSSDCTNV